MIMQDPLENPDYTTHEDRNDPPKLKCLNEDENCRGEVRYHGIGYPAKAFPRCDFHWERRLETEQHINCDYAPNSSCPPVGFDPTYCGERWDDDY